MFKKQDLHAIFIYLTLTKCTNFVVLLCECEIHYDFIFKINNYSLGVVAPGAFWSVVGQCQSPSTLPNIPKFFPLFSW